MAVRPISTLWLRLALPFLLFVAGGSLALALWLHASAQRESRRVFASLARTNAELIKSAKLPANGRVAEDLSRALNMYVFFRRSAWDMTAGGRDGIALQKTTEIVPTVKGSLGRYGGLLEDLGEERGIIEMGSAFEAVAVPLEKNLSLILVRDVEPAWSFLVRGHTLTLLALFWVFSVALAWIVARGFVRPLRLLAARLPRIETDVGGDLPGVERQDEIGQLARAYLATRAQLATERNRREQAERLSILGRMATGLAHEIHNPLAAIRMHAQLIESAHNGELAATAHASLPVLLGEASKIEGLVQQWMFLARPQPPQMTPSDFGEIVADVVRALTPQAAHAGVRIVNEVPSGMRARVDARRFSQAVGNIMLNAFQAMSTGGTLTVRGERSGSRMRLIFRDTGKGFSAEALAHYGDLFFSTKEGGMGIGLSVTSEIVKAHDGTLTVANAPEGGAVVTIQIPFRL